ncbi:hypothetical protein SESBI_27478 [Sesbania bispinosa]|nr:hypothetical protein SESBI_27478 [Sesbania bispinosa]
MTGEAACALRGDDRRFGEAVRNAPERGRRIGKHEASRDVLFLRDERVKEHDKNGLAQPEYSSSPFLNGLGRDGLDGPMGCKSPVQPYKIDGLGRAGPGQAHFAIPTYSWSYDLSSSSGLDD